MRATPGKSIHYDDDVNFLKAKPIGKGHKKKDTSVTTLLFRIFVTFSIFAIVFGVSIEPGMSDAMKTKCKQDLDVIRNAINLHDAQNRQLTGTDLQPLLGRYLCELPLDPHGNPYLLDANLGIVISFGEDGIAGGTGDDEDLLARYKPALRIQRAEFDVSRDAAQRGSRLYLSMTKPYVVVDDDELLRSIELLRNPYSETGDPISLATLNEEHDHKWRRLRNIPDDCRVTNEFGFDLLIFENEAAIAIDSPQFTKEMSVNFTFAAQPANGKVAFGLFAKPLDNGPTDERIFGSKAKKYILKPEHIPLYNGENRGIKVEYSPR